MVEEAERAGDAWSSRATIDVGAEMTRLTLAVVGRSLFGTEVGDEAERVAGVIGSIANRGGRLQSVIAALAPLMFAVRTRLPSSARFVFGKERATLEAVVDPIVARKRAHPGGDDLLATLLEMRDDEGNGLGDDDIRNELITFVLAGHETTSSALTWCWYLLAKHPAIEARLHRELDAVLGSRPPTLDDVAQLRYTAHIFDETLRLYPPAAAFGRRPLTDVTVGGYRIPRGASVFLSPFVTHRNPRYFRDPDAFVPERWEDEPPPKFAFFPFGGGSKMCIGEPFARAEGVLVLATLARRFRLRIDDAGDVAPGPSALLRPSRAIVARIERRVEAALGA
jgi:cytochrome P450